MAKKSKTDIKAKPEPKKLPRTKEVLLQDVAIGDKVYKKGESYPLTEAGKKYFKSLNYIK